MPMRDSVFVDSNLWLYAFVLRPGDEAKHARALALVVAPTRYVISTQVVSEVAVNLLKKAGMDELFCARRSSRVFYRRCRVVPDRSGLSADG